VSLRETTSAYIAYMV